MKWFRHECTAHQNLKLQALIKRCGLEGYAVYWICLELVGAQGERLQLNGFKLWRESLTRLTGLNPDRITEILTAMAEVHLISLTALKDNRLHIPKLREYADDYTKRVRTLDEQSLTRECILDLITKYLDLKHWLVNAVRDKTLMADLIKRNVRTAKQLLLLAGRDLEEAKAGLAWFAGVAKEGKFAWTLETVCRWWPEYLKTGKQTQRVRALEQLILRQSSASLRSTPAL